MVQGLTEAAGSDVLISFTPHLMPMTRGMQSTCYVKMADGVDVQQLRQRLEVNRGCYDDRHTHFARHVVCVGSKL